MKTLLTFIFLSPLFLFSQSDTITLDGTKTVSGKVSKIWQDRISLRDADGIEYLILKDRITHFKIRSEKKLESGEVGWVYVSDRDKLFSENFPEFKDQKYYLREAGAWGITSAALIIGGGIVSGIGAALKNVNGTDSGLILGGSITASIGTTLLIPTFVFVLKSGKVKSYRTL